MSRRRTADRYSRFVGALKVGLPLTGLALLVSVFMLSTQDEIPGGLSFSDADLQALGTGLRVTNPRFSGASLDGDIYDFVADSVIPKDASLEFADIETLSGTIRFRDGHVVSLSAQRAEINLMTEELILSDDINLQSSEGYNAKASRLDVDLKNGQIHGSGDVFADGPMGEISSDSLLIEATEAQDIEALANDSMITFTNRVRLRYLPNQN